jgi:aminoglycoside phosphotransferase (APT) family kinase protein
MQMHAGQLTVSTEVVSMLVRTQFPQWAGMPVSSLAAQGTVNAIFRIGDTLVARLPLQPGPTESIRRTIEAETAAARELLHRTSFLTPEPVAVGAPGVGYPQPWSIQTWVPGIVATEQDPGASVAFAGDLALFVSEVRALDTQGRHFSGTNRGGDLGSHDRWMQECFDRSHDLLDVPWLSRSWQQLRALPRSAPDLMTHGDLIPGNLLVEHDRLTGVIDVGGVAPADPALDLVGAWHMMDSGPRQVFREMLGCDDLEWARGAAWAFEQAVGLVWYYADSNPSMSRMGRRTLSRIADAFIERPDGELSIT